jgi:hypothetical protein
MSSSAYYDNHQQLYADQCMLTHVITKHIVYVGAVLKRLWGPNSIVPVTSTSTSSTSTNIINRPSSTRSLSAGRYESQRSSSVSAKPTKQLNDGTSSTSSKACPHIVAFHDAYTDPEKGCVCMVSTIAIV